MRPSDSSGYLPPHSFNMKYDWCLGIILDGNFNEKICNRRSNCQFYHEELFRMFSPEQLSEDFLLNEPGKECQYYCPRHKDFQKDDVEEPLLILTCE